MPGLNPENQERFRPADGTCGSHHIHGFQVLTATVANFFRRLFHSQNSTDALLIAYWCLLSLVSLCFHSRIPFWRTIVAANVAAVIVVCALARSARSSGSRVLHFVHDWAAFPLVVFTYKQLYFMIGPIHQGRDFDRYLIAIDRALFRVNPTEWLARFSNPYLTEVLQIAYSLFYALIVVVGLELYRKQNLFQFQYFRFTMVYGFFLSYIGYFFLPAVGPRFTLHDFSKLNMELPGLHLSLALRWFVNFCESIHAGVPNSVALANAQRDVFPSGHTMITLIVIIFGFKYRLKVRYCVLVAGALLILATVYLRYHYLVDLLAGGLLAFPCLLTSERVCLLLRGSQEAARQEPTLSQ